MTAKNDTEDGTLFPICDDIPESGNPAITRQKNDHRGIVICQILGLAALALVAYTAISGNFRALRYTILIIPAILIVVKQSLIPYVFIASFFTVQGIIESGFMFAIQIVDFCFLVFILAFISCNRIDFKAVLGGEQRRLFTILMIFMLWAAVGFAVNFYSHEPLANITSAFYVFNIAQLIAIVVLLSQPQWKHLRENFVFFFLICILFEIAGALTSRALSEEVSYLGFKKLTNTFGTPHHGSMGNILVLSCGIASTACFMLKNVRQKVFAGFVVAVSIGILLISGSRSSVMGLVAALPITALIGYRLTKKTLFLVLLAIAISLVIFWISPLKMALVSMATANDIDMSVYGRLLIWERVYEHAIDGPWVQKIFGIGIGTFNTLPFSYYLEAGTFAPSGHNNFFTAFVETGIVGLIIYLAFFAEIIRRLVIKSRQGDRPAKCFLVVSLALFFSCLTQETFWFSPAFGRFWIMYLFFYLILFDFDGNPTDIKQKPAFEKTANSS